MKRRLWLPIGLLVLVPVAPALSYLTSLHGVWLFLTGAIAIGVPADWIRRGTEHLAGRASWRACSFS